MTAFALTFESLRLSLKSVLVSDVIITLRVLKEAAIRDQSFELACLLRDMERQFSGGKTGINTKRKRASRPRSNSGALKRELQAARRKPATTA